jgi:hypothetical protein
MNVIGITDDLDQQKAALERLKRFDGGDGGGYDEKMDARLTALETRFDTVVPTLATKTDIESVKSEIHKSSGETHKWMLATVIGLFLGFGGLFLAMSNALKPPPQAAAPTAPIVITVPQQTAEPATKPAK